MMKKVALIVFFVLILGLYAMPSSLKAKIPFANVRNHLLAKNINLGLDLAGGRQLDYKVDLTRAKEQGKSEKELDEVVNGVAEVLRRRIDPDGTKELNIQTSDFGDEKHILVEITAGIDTEATRELLQKKIDLEFKELNDTANEEQIKQLEEKVKTVSAELAKTEDFAATAQALAEKDSKIIYQEGKAFHDQLTQALGQEVGDKVWNLQNGEITAEAIKLDEQSHVVFRGGEKQTAEREKKKPGEDFETVRAEVSESQEATTKVDSLPEQIKEQVLAITPGGTSAILETDDFYGIYKSLPIQNGDSIEMGVSSIIVNKSTEKAKEKIDAAFARLQETTVKENEEQLAFEQVFIIADISQWKSTGLDGQYFKNAKVDQDPRTGISIVSIQFDTEGAKLFEQITERNIGKPLAIFVGGTEISAPTINEKIGGGSAQITSGMKNFLDAKRWAISLTNDLNAGAIGAPIELSGDIKVKASLGEDALKASIFAAIIGFLILAVWMIFTYRLLGVLAVFALLIYVIIIVFVLKTTSAFVLTLAGIAGIVLSIGMAVDANILIFERMKEEIRDGKNFSAALSLGFERAWSSIRDSNISSLITCLILYIFGTSIIKGFAVMLALGILISMFTAITITKSFLEAFVGTKVSQKTKLFVR